MKCADIVLWILCGLVGLLGGHSIRQAKSPGIKDLHVSEARRSVLGIDGNSTNEKNAEIDAKFLSVLESEGPVQARNIRRLFELDPGRTLQLIDKLEDRNVAASLAGAILEHFPAKEFARLRAWMERQTDEEFELGLLAGLLPFWIREAPQEAIAVALDLGNSDRAKQARQAMFSNLLVADKLTYLEKLSDGEKLEFLHARSGSLSNMVPEQVATIIDNLPESKERSQSYIGMLDRWVRSSDAFFVADPRRAIIENEKLNDPVLKELGYKTIAFGWSATNSYLASQWVEGLPSGAARDAAAAGLARELVSEAPVSSFQWAQAIDDREAKMATLSKVVAQWANVDSEAVRHAIETSSLTASEKSKLFSTINL